jgi:KDO2-lipid IV(A) lauroyltransferase
VQSRLADQRGETWQETRSYWSYRVLERTARALPEAIGRPLASALGEIGYRFLPRVRSIVAANQARALGLASLGVEDERVRASTRDAFRLYMRYWYDTFRLRAMTPESILSSTEIVGFHHVEAALAKGRGCLAVLPHMGNWDLAGRFLTVKGYRAASVAEALRPHRLAELFVRHRSELGLRIVLLEGEGVAEELVALLAENWIVALLADRDLTSHGVEVEMFGAKRRVPAGPAVLALETGAALIAAAVYTKPGGWRIEVDPPLEIEPSGDRRADVRAISERLASGFERAIARRPADWHVFQPEWDSETETETDRA